ncbi:MAG: SBBP repeat-containing protein [Ignavibacteria bacterium]|nr:SBBP repeat-containing protein [Ignavibacteria bacterium]
MKNLKLNLLIVFSILLLINEMSFAQETFEWVRNYSDPGARSQTAYDIATDTNGNIYITGSNSNGYSVNDMVTIKYNASGQYLWGRTYNLSPDYTGELGKSIAVYRSGVKTYVYAAGEVAYSGLHSIH